MLILVMYSLKLRLRLSKIRRLKKSLVLRLRLSQKNEKLDDMIKNMIRQYEILAIRLRLR
jgi:hypothetical protein